MPNSSRMLFILRPASRTKKDINSHRVIVSHDCVFLADDYDVGTVGDTFSFEIKVSVHYVSNLTHFALGQ